MKQQLIIIILLVGAIVYLLLNKPQSPPEIIIEEKETIIERPSRRPSIPQAPVVPPSAMYQYRQVGILTDPLGGVPDVLPLYGRKAWKCSTRYQYYTRTTGYQAYQVRVFHQGRDCLESHCSSCEQIYDGSTVTIDDVYPGVNFKATVYPVYY